MLRFKFDRDNLDKIIECTNIQLYSSNEEHEKKCENCFVLLSSEYLFRIQLSQPEEKNINIKIIEEEYELLNISTNSTKTGNLPMINYSIPFDFNGKKFIWVEILDTEKRNLCAVDITNYKNDDSIYRKDIDHNYGHISFIKFLNDIKIIIVHSLNICEIRRLDKNFTLIEKFKHNGDEVYDITYLNYPGNDLYKKILFHKNKEELEGKSRNILINKFDVHHKRIKICSDDGGIYENKVVECDNSFSPIAKIKVGFDKINLHNSNNNKNDVVNAIITLDIDGNINWYENEEEKTLFNLYDIKEIGDEFKDKLLFSMGYEYFIKTNFNFFCISTDYGCFVIKREGNDGL